MSEASIEGTAAASDRPAARLDRAGTVYRARIARRYRADKVFRACGLGAILTALAMLALLVGSVLVVGLPAFTQSQVKLTIDFEPAVIPRDGEAVEVRRADYMRLVRQSLAQQVSDAQGRSALRELNRMVSRVGAENRLSSMVLKDRSIIGQQRSVWLPLWSPMDQYLKHGRTTKVSERHKRWLGELQEQELVRGAFNWQFLTGGASREAELAGLGAAIVGSFLTLVVTVLLAVPVAVAAAVYLEEFAPKNRLTELIEVNINNLAAVPSIVFGLLGLAVFLNFLGLPRATPLAGGAVLALMILPIVIIATRSALRAVPPSIREAALGVGASRQQTVLHHVLPLATPGIMTGTIIGMAQALGETAPLLMMGMVAFIIDVPDGFTDAATVLPVQIYQWAGFPEAGFREKTAAAIIVLLVFLIGMNAAAVLLRRRYEKRW